MLAVLYGSRIVTTSGLSFQPPVLSSEMQAVSFISAVYLTSISLPSQLEAIQIQSSLISHPATSLSSGFFFSSEKALLSPQNLGAVGGVGVKSEKGRSDSSGAETLCCDSGSEAPSELQGNHRAWWLRSGLSLRARRLGWNYGSTTYRL